MIDDGVNTMIGCKTKSNSFAGAEKQHECESRAEKFSFGLFSDACKPLCSKALFWWLIQETVKPRLASEDATGLSMYC